MYRPYGKSGESIAYRAFADYPGLVRGSDGGLTNKQTRYDRCTLRKVF